MKVINNMRMMRVNEPTEGSLVPDDEKGSVNNPYTIAEYETMQEEGLWNGGYVELFGFVASAETSDSFSVEDSCSFLYAYYAGNPVIQSLIAQLSTKMQNFITNNYLIIALDNGLSTKGRSQGNFIYLNKSKCVDELDLLITLKRELLHAYQEKIELGDNHSCREFQEHVIGDLWTAQASSSSGNGFSAVLPDHGNSAKIVNDYAEFIRTCVSNGDFSNYFTQNVSNFYSAFYKGYKDAYSFNNKDTTFNYKWSEVLDFCGF